MCHGTDDSGTPTLFCPVFASILQKKPQTLARCKSTSASVFWTTYLFLKVFSIFTLHLLYCCITMAANSSLHFSTSLYHSRGARVFAVFRKSPASSQTGPPLPFPFRCITSMYNKDNEPFFS